MRLSKTREKYLLQKYFNTKSDKNIPDHLSQFGMRSGDTTDEDLCFITQHVSAIDRLALGDSFVTIHGLDYLKKLKKVLFLDLRGIPLTDEKLDCLLHLAELEYLDIKNSQVSLQGVLKILISFSKLETLRIDIPIEEEAHLNSWKKKFINCELLINLK
ncbi:hypothetical protein [Flavobacterium sp.]|uniref:hypothetical protein n=1 Tax=Flavobacterium sp. TaxID=239 RepID=UPI00404889A4